MLVRISGCALVLCVTVLTACSPQSGSAPGAAAQAPAPVLPPPPVTPATTPVGNGMPVYFEFQVEKRVAVDSAVAPHYPDVLKATKLNGEVLAQFIVDTTGRADMSSFKVLRSTHDLFTQAVRAVLPAYRFRPAEIGGRKVRQLVQQPFVFAISP